MLVLESTGKHLVATAACTHCDTRRRNRQGSMGWHTCDVHRASISLGRSSSMLYSVNEACGSSRAISCSCLATEYSSRSSVGDGRCGAVPDIVAVMLLCSHKALETRIKEVYDRPR